jgi:hypothetical protein
MPGGKTHPDDGSDMNSRATAEIEEFVDSLDDPVANAREHESGEFVTWRVGADQWRSTGAGTACVGVGRLQGIREGANVALVGLVKDSRNTWEPLWETTLGRGRTRRDEGTTYCAFPAKLPLLTYYDNLHYSYWLIQVDGLERVRWDFVSRYGAKPEPEPTPPLTPR